MAINTGSKCYNFTESATLYETTYLDNDIPKHPPDLFCKKGALEKNNCYKFGQVKFVVKIIV